MHRRTICDPTIPLPTPLVGREQALAQIKQQLMDGGTVTLHGLPGVGKTALASTLAYDPEMRATFSGGVLWAALGPNPNRTALLRHWGTVLGISATERARLREIEQWIAAIRVAIGTRKMLVIIDDVWQMEEALTFRVGGQGCASLVTTRFPGIAAHLAGAMMTEELNAAQSLQLLSRLAPQVVHREVKLTQDLVQSVGGLPLALTLLGNYLRKQAYSGPARRIAAALERLSESSVRLQISEPHIPVDRYPSLPGETCVSLQSVIAVTDQLLPSAARAALSALSVFPAKPATFSEEAALVVTGCTTDDLDELLDAGLLECVGERYTLHQVVADYAHLYLGVQEKQDAHSRLIASITDYVEAHEKDYDLLDLESNTIRIALSCAFEQEKQSELVRIACAFAPFLILRGFYQEAERYLKRAAALLEVKDERIGALLDSIPGEVQNVPL